LKAYDELAEAGINIRVIDIFSIKPVDAEGILSASSDCQAIITVEDHYASGGMGEAVKSIDNLKCPVYNMTVDKIPRSGTPGELLEYEEISKKAIIAKIRGIIKV
jgi:transketolase